MNLIVDVSKALFLSSFSFSLPRSKSLVIDKLLCYKILESIRLIFSKNVFLAQRWLRQWRRKCLVVSISWPQLKIGFKQSWKLCLNLWSAKWFKPSLILASGFKNFKNFQTFKILNRRNSLWLGSNKLQYQVFKYMTRRKIANTDIEVIPFDYNCAGKKEFF